MRGGVLALDLAAAWGWAIVSAEGEYVASGHAKLYAAERGCLAHQLQCAISDLVTTYQPDFIAIEKPHSHHYGASRNLFGYAMVAHWVAHVRELGFVELGRQECYSATLGKGKGNKGKEAAVVFARQFKPLLNSDDEADAVMVAFAAHKLRVAA